MHGKIDSQPTLTRRRQPTLTRRNHPNAARSRLCATSRTAPGKRRRASSLGSLLGIEGNAARIYFSQFHALIKPRANGDDRDDSVSFDFERRHAPATHRSR